MGLLPTPPDCNELPALVIAAEPSPGPAWEPGGGGSRVGWGAMGVAESWGENGLRAGGARGTNPMLLGLGGKVGTWAVAHPAAEMLWWDDCPGRGSGDAAPGVGCQGPPPPSGQDTGRQKCPTSLGKYFTLAPRCLTLLSGKVRVGALPEPAVNAGGRKQIIPVIAFWLRRAFPVRLANVGFSWIMLKQILPVSKVISFCESSITSCT